MKKIRVVIEVNGGVADVTDTGSPGVEVVIIDWDNIKNGDAPNLPIPDADDDSLGAAAIREAMELGGQ